MPLREKASPGPWHLAGDAGLIINDRDGANVAACGGPDLITASANARLVESAPRMRSVLEATARLLRRQRSPEARGLLRRIETLIDKLDS